MFQVLTDLNLGLCNLGLCTGYQQDVTMLNYFFDNQEQCYLNNNCYTVKNPKLLKRRRNINVVEATLLHLFFNNLGFFTV